MKLRSIKRRVIARMLSCEVVQFTWALDMTSEIERLWNNHNRLINLLRRGMDGKLVDMIL